MNSRKKGQRFVKWAWVLPMVALVLASFASGGARLILAEDGTAPRFWVWPELDGVEGLRWHGAVTITFDDDFDVSNGYLHSTSASVDEQGSFQLWLDAFDVQAGQVVTVDDGLASRVHQVTGLRIESMDRLTDKVSGWATPYAEVEVEAGDDSGSSRRTVMADGDGNWVADFSVPWDGEPALDIGDDTAAQATQWDTAGGDGTRVYRRQPNSRFWVWPELDGVEGLRWHGAVTITFDDDFDVSNGYLHSTSASVDEQGSFQLWLDAFDVQAGQVVTVDDGLASRVHQVTGLRIEVVDMQADTISGWATPNAEVEVEAGNDSGSSRRTVMADGDGNWVADFSVPWDGEPALDIGPGSGAEATQWDTAGGDGTRVFRRLRAPRFDVQPLDDFVRGEDWWPVGAEVTLTIDDPSTPEQPDYAQTEMVVPSPSDPEQTSVGFDFGHAFDVEPGHLVRLTDGISTKEHVVTNVAVSYVSTGADRVVGTADPGARIDIRAIGDAGWACRHETADAAGNWLADFAVPGDEADEQGTFDIRPGEYVAVDQADDDWDRTSIELSAPVADAGPDRTVIRGETVLFDGSGSSDADGTIEAYDWDFGDGNTGSGIATTHVYADAGPYVATLTVTDNDGAQATDAAVVMVQTPQEATEDVVDVVQEMELDQGIEDSLIDKLQNAIDYLNTGQIDQAIGALRALMHETEALRGKKLTDEQADQLITAAQRILNSI